MQKAVSIQEDISDKQPTNDSPEGVTNKQSDSLSLGESEEMEKCQRLLQEIELEKTRFNNNTTEEIKTLSPTTINSRSDNNNACESSPTKQNSPSTGDIETGNVEVAECQRKYSFWNRKSTKIIAFCVTFLICIGIIISMIFIGETVVNPIKRKGVHQLHRK